ncbi:MAG: hypothetical protein AB7I79_06325 [Rhizobiaceae bacterium]
MRMNPTRRAPLSASSGRKDRLVAAILVAGFAVLVSAACLWLARMPIIDMRL